MLVIEHNLDVIADADWVIYPGPEGDDRGGTVVFEGTPTRLLPARDSLTGEGDTGGGSVEPLTATDACRWALFLQRYRNSSCVSYEPC